MTKKDYEVIAAAVRDMILTGSDYHHVINKLCYHLAKDNARFDEVRFRDACRESILADKPLSA